MIVKPQAVERFLAKPPADVRAVLFYGPDAGLVRERAERLARSVCEDLRDPFRIAEFSGSDLKSDPAKLGDEAAAIAMLGGRRVVRVRDAEPAAASFDVFIEDLPGDALVVAEAGDLEKSSALRKLFEAAGDAVATIACYGDEAEALEDLIGAILKKAGLEAEPDAVAELVQRLGEDRRMTRSELDKLVLYMGPSTEKRRVVTREDVRAIIGTESDSDLSDAIDAAAGGEMEALDRAFASLMASGAHPASLARSAVMHFEKLHLACAMAGPGGAGAAVDRAFFRPHFRRKPKLERQCRIWTVESAMDALLLLGEAEAQCKTTHLPDQAICGRALIQIAAMAKQSALKRA